MIESFYIYRFGSMVNAVSRYRLRWKGRRCRLLARGKLNSCLLEFPDTGERLCTSRNALRKVEARNGGCGGVPAGLPGAGKAERIDDLNDSWYA